MEVSRKPFKGIELDDVRVEEGWKIQIVTAEEGEAFEGIVTKIEGKKMTIHVEGEIYGRVFDYPIIGKVEVISKEVVM